MFISIRSFKCLTKSLFSYQMCGVLLEVVEQHNYLGVHLHHRLSWQPHIDSINFVIQPIASSGFCIETLDIALVN